MRTHGDGNSCHIVHVYKHNAIFSENDMGENLVSIIRPCFNSEKFIGQSFGSVLNQTYQSWELPICDDGSDDG